MTDNRALPASELLSPLEASKLIGVSESTLHRWRGDLEHLPYRVIGSRFFYDRREVTAYLERGRVEVVK